MVQTHYSLESNKAHANQTCTKATAETHPAHATYFPL